MEYACKKAQEGTHSAMVKDTVVFGWAIHYFEEDSIEGSLFNIDGTPYLPPKPKYQPKPTTTSTIPVKKPDIQPNMFDLLSKNDATDDNDDTEEDITEDDVQEALEECTKEEQKQISPFYSKYLDIYYNNLKK